MDGRFLSSRHPRVLVAHARDDLRDALAQVADAIGLAEIPPMPEIPPLPVGLELDRLEEPDDERRWPDDWPGFLVNWTL